VVNETEASQGMSPVCLCCYAARRPQWQRRYVVMWPATGRYKLVAADTAMWPPIASATSIHGPACGHVPADSLRPRGE
jgi:hypothetical protein